MGHTSFAVRQGDASARMREEVVNKREKKRRVKSLGVRNFWNSRTMVGKGGKASHSWWGPRKVGPGNFSEGACQGGIGPMLTKGEENILRDQSGVGGMRPLSKNRAKKWGGLDTGKKKKRRGVIGKGL